MRNAFINKGFVKNSKTEDILGCKVEFFNEYIESKFTNGMSWERISDIHLDHIIPLATVVTEEDIYRLNHYTNFQPLWAKDNLQKSDKVPENVQFKLL